MVCSLDDTKPELADGDLGVDSAVFADPEPHSRPPGAFQGLEGPETFCVTLNASDLVDPKRILRTMTYHHPEYTQASVAAQKRRAEISGVRRTHYCGAYWGYGFHEDGVKSGLAVARAFGKTLDSTRERDGELHLSRVDTAQAVYA